MIPSQLREKNSSVQKRSFFFFFFFKIIMTLWWIPVIISLRFIEIGWLDDDSESRRTAWERICSINLFSQAFQELMITKLVEGIIPE